MLCFPSTEVSYVEKLTDFLTNLFESEVYSHIYASEESLSIRSYGEITSEIQGKRFQIRSRVSVLNHSVKDQLNRSR